MTDEYTKERAAVLAMLMRGEATISELARLAGVSRQLVFYWSGAAGIDPSATRRAYLKARWERRMP